MVCWGAAAEVTVTYSGRSPDDGANEGETSMPVSTMMDDYQLTLKPIFEFGRQVHADKKIITFTGADEGGGYVESTFAQVADRADQLAAALTKLGVRQGDRVGTFLWNNQTHMEAYLAIPVMGAVLHTLNIRLFPSSWPT